MRLPHHFTAEVRQPSDAVQEHGTLLGGRRQSRWPRTADGFAVLNSARWKLCILTWIKERECDPRWDYTLHLSLALGPLFARAPMSDDEEIHLHVTYVTHMDMDEAFRACMRIAIAAGLESAPIGVVTTPGTQNPKYTLQQR